MMKFTEPEQVTKPLHPEIADSVLATLKREIDARLAPADAENLHTHMLYLAMSMIVLLKQNEEPGMDNKRRLFYIQEAMELVERFGTSWYFD